MLLKTSVSQQIFDWIWQAITMSYHGHSQAESADYKDNRRVITRRSESHGSQFYHAQHEEDHASWASQFSWHRGGHYSPSSHHHNTRWVERNSHASYTRPHKHAPSHTVMCSSQAYTDWRCCVILTTVILHILPAPQATDLMTKTILLNIITSPHCADYLAGAAPYPTLLLPWIWNLLQKSPITTHSKTSLKDYITWCQLYVPPPRRSNLPILC